MAKKRAGHSTAGPTARERDNNHDAPHPRDNAHRTTTTTQAAGTHSRASFCTLHACVVVAVCVAVYANTCTAELVYDDGAAIRKNADVSGDGRLRDVFVHDFWGGDIRANTSHKSYRPLTTLTFRANHALHGLRPAGYHAVNVCLHACVCVLVYCTALRMFAHVDTALYTALLFATHPIHTEAVANVVCRAELLCALAYLTGFLAYVSADESRSLAWDKVALCCGAVTVAVLSKETGITAPIMYLLADLFFVRANKEHTRNWICVLIKQMCVWTVILGYLALRASIIGDGDAMPTIHKVDNPALHAMPFARWLTWAYLHARYAWLLVCPVSLSADYSFNAIPVLESLSDVRVLAPIAFYVVLLALLVLAARMFVLSTGVSGNTLLTLLWVLVPFSVASNVVFPVATTIAERLLYLPSFGFCLGLAYAFVKFGERSEARHQVARYVLIALLVFYSARTITRGADWHDNGTLFHATVAAVPHSMKAHRCLAGYYNNQSRLQEGLKHYRISAEIMPEQWDAHYEYGNALQEAGDIAGSIEAYGRAIDLNPTHFPSHNHKAFMLVKLQRFDEAVQAFKNCLVLRPNDAEMTSNLGNLAMMKENYKEATEYYVKAMQLDPTHTAVYYNLAVLSTKKQSIAGYKEALSLLQKAHAIDGSDEGVVKMMGAVASTLKKHGAL